MPKNQPSQNTSNSKQKKWYHITWPTGILILIIVLSFGLRLYNLTAPDSYTDEVMYSFRGLGMIDYDTSPTQTTPWQWFKTVPWWAHLSFHDHPIVFFEIEHVFLKLLGTNLWAVRLPSVFAGVLSIFLLYLILRKLFNPKTALIGSFLLSINSYHLWVSRLGIQDGTIIMLILLAFWLWLKITDNKKYWLWLGLICGLGIITKYTFIIIFPLLIWHALIYKNKFYKNSGFWWCLLIIFIVTTPTWLYNLMLYNTRGHFDFQISAMLGQHVPEWTFRMGRVLAGNTSTKLSNFFLALNHGNSIWFNSLSAFSFLSLFYFWKKTKEKIYSFLIGTCILFFGWFIIIGSTYRFVIMIVPWLVLGIAALFSHWQKKHKLSLYIFIALFSVAELFYSINSFLIITSVGTENIAYAKINVETQNFGFNQLGLYLDKTLCGYYSLYMGQPEYDFLTQLAETHIENMKTKNIPPIGVFIVYDKRLNFLASLWTLDRRMYYEGWPVVDKELFEKITKDKLDDYYKEMGVKKIIYVEAASDKVCSPDYKNKKLEDSKLKIRLKNKGIKPTVIKNNRGEDSFYVYEF